MSISIRRLGWFLILLLIVMGTFGKRGWLDLRRMRSENDKLNQQIIDLEKQRAKLESEVTGLTQNKNLQEHTIRRVLGYIRPDEIVIEF